jgi:hypothetical protein
VSWVEIAGYVVILLLALGLIWATYVASRRLTGSSKSTSRLIPFAVGGATAILSVLLTLYATHEIERHSWPTVVVSQRGTDLSDPVYLGGTYTAEWTAIGGQSGCHIAATLRGADENPYSQPLFEETIPARTNTGGPTTILTVARDAYYIDATVDCPSWSIVLTPRR